MNFSLCNISKPFEKLFKDDISQIVSSGNSMLDIVNNILDISKIETGKQTLIEKEYKLLHYKIYFIFPHRNLKNTNYKINGCLKANFT